jgi:methylmalonyl-CoA carboxyltransferase large subunit
MEEAMSTQPTDLAHVLDAVEALRQQVARLGERVAALEACAGTGVAPAATSAPPAQAAEGLSEELILVISAAIAAYLGKKPHIRQIRLLRSDAWAQQGRATIQASHALQFPATRRSP